MPKEEKLVLPQLVSKNEPKWWEHKLELQAAMHDLNDPELLKTCVERVEAHVKLVWYDPVGHRRVLAMVVRGGQRQHY
jgi:hypothetical protein